MALDVIPSTPVACDQCTGRTFAHPLDRNVHVQVEHGGPGPVRPTPPPPAALTIRRHPVWPVVLAGVAFLLGVPVVVLVAAGVCTATVLGVALGVGLAVPAVGAYVTMPGGAR